MACKRPSCVRLRSRASINGSRHAVALVGNPYAAREFGPLKHLVFGSKAAPASGTPPGRSPAPARPADLAS
jgi:hypothetical protein